MTFCMEREVPRAPMMAPLRLVPGTEMSAETSIVNELIELARDRSFEGRRQLVQNIADLYIADSERLSDHERAIMSEILCKLMFDIELEVKSHLAVQVAELDNVPEDLIVMLGNEDIEVARPILEKSNVLRDPDLIEIVRRRSDEHRLAIAIRGGLSAEVSSALVIYGDEDVIEALLRNRDAEISQSAMEYLVAESERVDRFQEPLIARADLPPEFAHRMFWWVSAALRRHILLHYRIDQARLDTAIQDATRKAIERHSESEGADDKALTLVKRMRDAGELDIPFLIQAVRQERTPLFVAGLALMANVPVNMCWRIFSDQGGESLAVVFRAIGMERTDFASLFLLISQARAGGRPQDPSVLARIIELYDRIDRKTADAALSYWRRDLGYQSAIDALESR